MELENQSILCNMPNGDLLHVLKDTKSHDKKSRDLKNIYPQEASNAKEILGSHSTIKSTDMKTSSLGLLDGEYRGLTKQLSIEYVDIFEILKAELSAEEAREFELIENELLNYDINESEIKNHDWNEEECSSTNVTELDIRRGHDFTRSFVLEDGDTFPSNSALAHGDVQDNFGLKNGHYGPLYRSPNLQSSLMKGQVPKENINLALTLSVDSTVTERVLPVKREEDSGENKDGGPPNVELKCDGEVKDACLDDEVGALQNSQKMPRTEEKTVSVQNHNDAEKAGKDVSANLLIPEVIGDLYPTYANDAGDGKGNIDSIDRDNCEEETELLQIDECSEYSEDEENAPIPFPGPIPFSGILSYSGVLSQLPYSGSLSLHSESSTSTRSFAFPVLGSDWTTSPAKIGPPDSRYLRRRRRWRPSFCCSRPSTLFD